MRLIPIILVILLLPSVSGLGLSPARQVYDGEEFVITVRDAPGPIEASVEGPYADAFTLSIANERIVGTIGIDPAALPPGDHDHRIIVRSAPSNRDGFSAIVELVSIVTLRSAFDGPYLVANGFTEPINSSASRIVITIENRGNAPATLAAPALNVAGSERTLDDLVILQGDAVQIRETLEGRGQHDLILRAGDFTYGMPIAIGRPLIVDLQATQDPDGSSITPIDVSAAVDWNVPVRGTIGIGADIHEISIDGEFSERFYLEEASENIPVILTVGGESATTIATRPEIAMSGTMRPWWIMGILLLLGITIVLVRRLRRKE